MSGGACAGRATEGGWGCPGRALLAVLAGALALAACASAMTPDRETGGGATGSARTPGATAGSEAAGAGDWTATVRPLGSSDTTFHPIPGGASGSAEADQMIAQASARSSTTNPAVRSLLDSAARQFQAGDYARAASTLERAIAIEPRNAWLWHHLAGTRLAQGRLDQAAELAAKSNTLATSDRAVEIGNWRLIAEVRRRQGDSAGAAAAQARAAKLAN